MSRQLYALFTIKGGHPSYFYVGKSHEPARRMKQHVAGARVGRHEDVYDRIRELNAHGISWEMEILGSIAASDYEADAERFEIIRMVRAGHQLMNMRHGSRETQEEAARQVADPAIRSAADVRRDRERITDGKRQASRKLRRDIQLRELNAALQRGIPDVSQEDAIPAIIRRRLAAGIWPGRAPSRIPAGGFKNLSEFIEFVRIHPNRWRALAEVGRQARVSGY